MNEYRNLVTGEIFTETEVRENHEDLLPTHLNPELLAAMDLEWIIPNSEPKATPGTRIERDGVKQITLDNGKVAWTYKWKSVPLPAAEASMSIEQARLAVWDEIKKKRTAVQFGGILIDGHWFHSDLDARNRYVLLDALGRQKPEDDPLLFQAWETMDGTVVPMTRDLVAKLILEITTRDDVIYRLSKQHKQLILKIENPLTYRFQEGWPKTFDEWLVRQQVQQP